MQAKDVPLTRVDLVGDIHRVVVDLPKTKTDKILANGAPLVWIYGKVIGHVYQP